MLVVVVGKTLVVTEGSVVLGGVVVLVAGRDVVGLVVFDCVVVVTAGVVEGSLPPPQAGSIEAERITSSIIEINLTARVENSGMNTLKNPLIIL
jgi:hypothetical protein